jgi:hypothetical protein
MRVAGSSAVDGHAGEVEEQMSVNACMRLWMITMLGVVVIVPDRPARAEDLVVAPAPRDAVETYQQRFVWFYDYVTISGIFGRSWRPYQGKYRAPLDGEDFYLAIGRPDLASRYRARYGLRVGLLVGGGVVVLGAWGILASKHEGAAVAAAVGGFGTMFVGSLLATDPIGESEARQLADEYNKGLKGTLNLGLGGATPAPRRPIGRGLVLPTIAVSGGGLSWLQSF